MLPYKAILEKRKTPFYVFDQDGFIENYTALQNAMRAIYPRYKVAYSYKTNYTPYVCELVKGLGGYAEVVSDMEYTLAKKLGYKNDRIVYNGPAKGYLLEEHLLNNGIVNIDSVDEAERVARIAKKHDSKAIKVGLRINLDIGSDFISRFGLYPASADFHRALKLLENVGVNIVGIHCHISRNRGIDAWKRRAQIMLDTADTIFGDFPEYISLGSGMFADMSDELRGQFRDVPTYTDYALAVMKPFWDRYGAFGPLIFTEPGTTVVSRYFSFISSVLSIKEIRGRYMATMDGSSGNLGEICTLLKLPVRVIKSNNGKSYESVDLMGYTCLEQDMMYSGYTGQLAVGDILVFENVGGYSIVSKAQFICPNCPAIAYSDDGYIKTIMREETFDDVFSKFIFTEN